ncbi:potassium-transporting ATPase subunit KdpA, partial [Mesorhizobium sp. M7A.F.Ca.US.001.01.1.1]
MTLNGWIQILVYCGIVILLVKPLGGYMHRVFNGDRTLLSPVFGPLERGLYRVCGTSEREEQHWTTYAVALLLFNLAGFLVLYALQRLQGSLPYNPAGMTAVEPGLAFNTAASFMTNTNWQNYGGESTMSYLVQMAGLTVQNFVSAATGIAIAIALIRGFARASGKSIGNFWVDMTRSTLYLLLPFCIVLTLAYVWLGMPQTLGAYVNATTLEGAQQTIAVGPVASQVAIKMLGTNGGGFFNANAAHPFENPDAISNLIQMVSIFAIGAALTNVFGRMIGNQRQGWAILSAMGVMFIAGVAICYWAEAAGNPLVHALGIDGGNMEGKETRFGIALSALFAVITTAASCGAVNAMHGSFTALGGMIPIINMQLGEVIVGGVGAGLYGILMYIVVAVFVAGLMVGRTPEYLGKKIEAKEVKMAMLAILCLPLAMLIFTAIAVVLPTGVASMGNAGPHGFSEVLYAYTSAAANNGSAFGGLSGNTPWYNITIG